MASIEVPTGHPMCAQCGLPVAATLEQAADWGRVDCLNRYCFQPRGEPLCLEPSSYANRMAIEKLMANAKIMESEAVAALRAELLLAEQRGREAERAAVAMVKDATELASWLLASTWALPPSKVSLARRILASRPSEQASNLDEFFPSAAQEELIDRLTKQLAEAKADLAGYTDAWGLRLAELDETKAKLEAAEAERAHLLEAAELLRRERMSARDHQLWGDDVNEWRTRDQARAAAATEESQPQPHPQPERLGGPADKLRADIVKAARAAGGMTESQWQTFAELMGKNP